MFAAATVALASPALASPTSTSSAPACPDALPASYVDAFGVAIEDRAVLRFIRILSDADGPTRSAAIASARKPLDSAGSAAIATAVAARSCSPVTTAATERMAAAISQSWEISNDEDAERMSARIADIASALSAKSTLERSLIDALLAPYGTTLVALEAPEPVHASGESCVTPDADARIEHVARLSYPVAARIARASGSIQLKVELDTEGDVKRVTIYKDSLAPQAQSQSLRDEAVRAAGTTLYAPASTHCTTIAGAYIFRADFRAQR
ncbi:MAG: energy transducer TonB [Candidatus Eremiobacteraeota bacterium]|nr:energy transducer TonB [Candidatus Eremiobacteraeota bacterium]